MPTIPERARDLRHAIAELVTEDRGWSGRVDSATDTLLRAALSQPTAVYVIKGESGDRSNEDESYWTVAAYLDERMAEEHLRRVRLRAKRLYAATRKWSDRYRNQDWVKSTYVTDFGDVKPGSNPYDPYMEWNGWGVRYSIEPMEIQAEVKPIR